jgi:hypothetical protein
MTELAQHGRRDEADEQAQDDNDNEQFQKRETRFMLTPHRGSADGF